MPGSSTADILRECSAYLVTLEVNVAELPSFIQQYRAELAVEVEKLKGATIRQAQHKALLQKSSQEAAEGRTNCATLATRIRTSLRGFYGPSDEKLNEFSIQPRRFERSSTKTKTKPPETGPTPPQAATPAAGVTT